VRDQIVCSGLELGKFADNDRVGSDEVFRSGAEAARTELRARPTILREIHPERLEALVADVLRDHFCAEVEVIDRPGDGGIDLVFVNGEHPFAVQVKRRESPESSTICTRRPNLSLPLTKPRVSPQKPSKPPIVRLLA
jgi:hypothetical protein